jgi:hypothetical protein
MATEQEVEDQRARVVELRARLEEVRTGGVDTQRELENEIILTQLQDEEAKIAAEIALAEQAARPSAMAQSVRAPLGTIQEQMQRSVAHQQAVAAEIQAANKNDAPSTPTPTPSSEPSSTPTPAPVAPAASDTKVKG